MWAAGGRYSLLEGWKRLVSPLLQGGMKETCLFGTLKSLRNNMKSGEKLQLGPLAEVPGDSFFIMIYLYHNLE